MDEKQIDNFFKALAENLKGIATGRIKIILTGAAAGILMGGNRPSIDIDFSISCDKKYLKSIEDAIKKASNITGISANFSEDIDRWSQITFLDYKKHTRPYNNFGKINVSILSPEYWSIGKIARYIDPDVNDLVKVLKKNPLSAIKLSRLWGEALLKSPRSSASFTFRTHVEHFLNTYGHHIWGKSFHLQECLYAFWSAAEIKPAGA